MKFLRRKEWFSLKMWSKYYNLNHMFKCPNHSIKFEIIHKCIEQTIANKKTTFLRRKYHILVNIFYVKLGFRFSLKTILT